MDVSQLTPRRPYLLRAFYDWLLDNQLTPHGGGCDAAGRARADGVRARWANRSQYCPACGRQSRAGERRSALQRALWRGTTQRVCPLAAVLAIYARENGAGTMFEPEAAYDEDVSCLNDDDVAPESESETVMSVIDGDKPDNHDDDPDDTPPPRGGRPALRVVK